jgi:arylsulfatase A-like enzyme
MKSPRAIVFITFDCLRPDHLGCYGYKEVDTPNIDKIASDGVVFRQAISQAPNTWVSHASIFTGCNPYKHGVRNPFTKLNEKISTIAEVLSKKGFATAGFPSHTLLGPILGFDRGFDFYDLELEDFQYFSNVENNKYYRKWDNIWDKAKMWIKKQNNPFFIWFHYMGIHEMPLESLSLPPEFKKKYSPLGQYYDGKVSFADMECMEPILSFFKNNEMYDDSIFVLFSDHGERFIDTTYPGGGAKHNEGLFEEVVRISLILCAPYFIKGEKHVVDQVRSIDIMPTVLGLIDSSIPTNIDGINLIPHYILPKVKKNKDEILYAYMENLPYNEFGLRTPEWKLILKRKDINKLPRKRDFFDFRKYKPYYILRKIKGFAKEILKDTNGTRKDFSKGFLFLKLFLKNANKISTSFLSGRFYNWNKHKLWKSYDVKSLYNLKNDPDERYNVYLIYPDVVNKLRSQFVYLIKNSFSEGKVINGEEEKKIEKKLKDLGYY